MFDTIRDSAVGQLLRFVTGNSIGIYPEESSSFQLPQIYTRLAEKNTSSTNNITPQESIYAEVTANAGGQSQQILGRDIENQRLASAGLSATTSSHSLTNTCLKDEVVNPSHKKDEITIVTWYSDDDPENPQNWSFQKKAWIASVIFGYTFAVYIGSSLYSAGEADIVVKFGVSDVAASLGLALYVIGYGLGPLLFSPLSEIPIIGRNPPYILTFTVFVILCLPASLIDNFGGLLVLRFLLGFFGSPCLATAPASFGDILDHSKLVYAIAFWALVATLGPSLGPVVAGFAVMNENWRWSAWELLWIASPILLLMLFTLPETSADTILLRRAQRLRARTGRNDLQAESEIKQSKISARNITFNALIKPWEINIRDPAVLFTSFYTGLVYGIFYSFFESLPLAYPLIYHFNLGENGLTFLPTMVGAFISCTTYCAYLYHIAIPHLVKAGASIAPEYRLQPGLIATFFIPCGLFIFAWTTRPSIHWIVSMVGVTITNCGIFIIIQCMFAYLAFTYPKYSASLFAANGLIRSAFGAGAILFSNPMFQHLGVPGGVSLLAGFTVACAVGLYVLYFFGATLRRKSRFAAE